MSDEEELVTITIGEDRPAPEPVEQQWVTDEVCAGAVDRAREALLEEVDAAQVGVATGLVAEGPLVVTHYFEAQVPGYVGWRWAVTVTRAPDSEDVTIDETALLPDEHALLAPTWVPWKNRIQSGDIGAGDVLVTEPDDPRLLPGFTANDLAEDDVDEIQPQQWELGLGRERMLSPEGRREAAHRWYRETGPRSQIARAADLHCVTCGFLLLIGGPLGQAFGVCANGFSPVDGRIVAMDFGCGAHSETVQAPLVPVADTVVDEVGYDAVEVADAGADASDGEPEPQTPDTDSREPSAAPAAEPDAHVPSGAASVVPSEPADSVPAEGPPDESMPVAGEVAEGHDTMQGMESEEDS